MILSKDRGTRSHRVVRLTVDEARLVDRDPKTRPNPALCCGHLSIFHTRGTRRDGSQWGICNVSGCECSDETEAPSRDPEHDCKALARAVRRWQEIAVVTWMAVAIALILLMSWWSS